MTDLLAQCHAQVEKLRALRPLSAEQEARVLQKLRLDWNYHSNHLEGNSLTYGETKALILHGLTAQGKPLQDHFEITGHNEAIHWIEDLVQKREALTEHVVRQLHTLILKEDHYIEARTVDGQPTRTFVEVGRYKTTPNHVQTITGEPLFFSSPADVPHDMEALFKWFRETTDDPIIVASFFHYRFIRIHPFADGNGRVARLIMNFILMMAGYPPVIVKTQEKDAYFSALRLADAGNVDAFVQYIAGNLLRSIELMIRAAMGERIDEPDDVDKELALLRQKFASAGEERHATKGNGAVAAIWEGWLREWLITFTDRAGKEFKAYYLRSEATWNPSTGVRKFDFHNARSQLAEQLPANTSQLFLMLVFSSLRKVGLENFDYNFTFFVRFEPTQYTIRSIHGPIGHQSFAYDVRPTDEQLSDWISIEFRHHAKAIEAELSKLN